MLDVIAWLLLLIAPTEKLHIDKRAGVEWRHRVGHVELAVKGPKLKRGAWGLLFEVRF